MFGGASAATADHGANPNSMLVDNFEDGVGAASPTGHWQNQYVNGVLKQVWFNGYAPEYRVNLWGGSSYGQADAFGASTYVSSLGAGDNSKGALRFGPGIFGRPADNLPTSNSPTIQNCGQVYPFVQHGMYLSPEGASGDASVFAPGVTYSNAGAQHGLMFQYKNGVLQQALTVKLILLKLYQYAYDPSTPCNAPDVFSYHQYLCQLSTNSWGQVKINFNQFVIPGTPTGEVVKALTNYGQSNQNLSLGNPSTAGSDGTLRVMAIEFDPTYGTLGTSPYSLANNAQSFLPITPVSYDFSIDNIQFY
jgi:hypothetical protein